MSYYQQFKPEADKQAGALAKTVSELSAQIPKIQKRLAEEKENAQRLIARIEKLKAVSGESLTGDDNSYEKFKVALKKINNDFAVSNEIVETLSAEILPKAQRDFATAQQNLKIKLNAYLLQCRPVADKKINDLLRQCIIERQAFLDAFAQLFSDYGLSLIVSDESYCPGVWESREVHDLRIRLGITDTTKAATALQGALGAQSGADPYQTTPKTIVEAQTPSEDIAMKVCKCENCQCQYGESLDDAAFSGECSGLCDSCREKLQANEKPLDSFVEK